ncbi:TetR/AcrR family transcriptional regulator [Sphingomonas sp. BK235]|uniref:TetR/AcrR family transcriptional regulator n=1 Tax=Sphingomonas sp. BK235 TaxID=2512131 RepID=UPI001049CF4F|nr:TetR/AcrR family transcriptional regulator [Sphingomonas sp. BK235]TCP29684.1 TetR family transcriptional regulator [Sphingomonas sp. BK235]
MSASDDIADTPAARARLTKAARRRQLLDIALALVRAEGAERLTLPGLAQRAGISKPVVYDHFGSRDELLVAVYRAIDAERGRALRDTVAPDGRDVAATAARLAAAYVRGAADHGEAWDSVGAALAGSEEKGAVDQELLDGAVATFVAALAPHEPLPRVELERRCIGLVGAGEALSGAMMRGLLTERAATAGLTAIIAGALAPAE